MEVKAHPLARQRPARPALAELLRIYVVGVGVAVTGALGLAEAIDVSVLLSVVLFFAGLAAVVFVHEYLGGPI